LVKEHSHAVNAAVSGLTALPGTGQSFAATRAMTRFLNHPDISFAALLEPAQDAVRTALAASPQPVALVVHDWCMFGFGTHASKKDRIQRSHDVDLGYELGTALVVETGGGRPLGPMELRLRTAGSLLSTRVGVAAMPPGHIDEVLDAMTAARGWNLGKSLIHVIDREADSVGHYRDWQSRGHSFLVRADDDRLVLWQGRERTIADVVAELALEFRDAKDASGEPEVVTVRAGTGRVRVVETQIVLHRPARKATGERTPGGHKKKIDVPGPPIPLRLIVTRIVGEQEQTLAEWCLLSNTEASTADAATLGRWYAWRWRIETFHKLLKSAGLNAEEWQQESGAAFLRRLCVGAMACLTVWHLQRADGEAAQRLRKILVRLSGRQMKHGVESTATALLAGLEKLLALDDLLQTEDVQDILALARQVLPQLFHSG
jgi:Transposase DDE domain